METLSQFGHETVAPRIRRWVLDPPLVLRLIAGMWVLAVLTLTVVLAPSALAFMKHTHATFRPPDGSVTETSERFIDRHFLFLNPPAIEEALTSFVFTSADGKPLFDTHACPPVNNASAWTPTLPPTPAPRPVNGSVYSTAPSSFSFAAAPFPETAECRCLRNWTHTIADYGAPIEIVRGVKGYFLPRFVLPIIGPSGYMSKDRQSTVIAVNTPFNEKIGRRLAKAVLWLLADVSGAAGSSVDDKDYSARLPCAGSRRAGGIRVTVSSTLLSISQMETSVVSSLVRIDEVSLPVALLLLIIATRSVRLALIPIVALPVCTVLVFASLRPYEETHPLPPMLPEMVVALIVALNIDFSLFLNTRFREAYAELYPEDGGDDEDDHGDEDDGRSQGGKQAKADQLLLAMMRSWYVAPTVALRDDAEFEFDDGGRYTRWHIDDGDQASAIPPHLRQLAVVVVATVSCTRNIGFSGFTIAAVFGALAVTANDGLIRMPAVASMAASAGSCGVALVVLPALMYVAFVPLAATPPCCRKNKSSPTTSTSLLASSSSPGPLAHSPSEFSMNTAATAIGAHDGFDGGGGKAASLAYRRYDGVADGDDGSNGVHRAGNQPSSCAECFATIAGLQPWRAMATFAARHPWPVVVAFLAIAAPFAWVCAVYFQVGFSLYAEIPIGSSETARLRDVAKAFSPQVDNSFYLLFRYPSVDEKQQLGADVAGSRFIAMVTAAIAASMSELHRHCPQAPAQVTHPFAIPLNKNNSSSPLTIASSLQVADGWYSNDTGGYRTVASLTITPGDAYPTHGYAAAAPLQLTSKDPWGEIGNCVVAAFHAAHGDFGGGNYTGEWVGYFGPNSASYAVSTHVYAVVGRMVGAVAGVLGLCSLIFFRSVFVALRLLLTMAWTLVMSFGITLLIFVTPATRVDGDYMAALHWFVPVLGFALVTAITLDYDGFVLSRVIEERRKPGMSDARAVVAAVAKTGSVITFAGAIMVVAFGSLALSDMLLLRQFAVVISVSVLLDTFVVRPIFVPALIATAGWWAWWPRKMPDVSDDDDDGDSDDDEE